jgi:hypothetical protein
MGTIIKPNSFSASTTISSSQVNSNFDTIYNEFNGSISAANLATDAVTTVKIADSNITTAKLADNAVTTAKITNASVTADKLSTGATAATVATSEGTTSSAFTDLATAGPAATVTIGANGMALVILYASLTASTSGDASRMGYAVSGATTVAAGDSTAILFQSGTDLFRGSAVFLHTGLTPGSNVFTAKYRRGTAGTATFADRKIAVIPL